MRLALAAATAVAGLVSVSVSIARADDADAPYAPPDFLREEPVLPGGGDGAWRLDLAGAIQLAVTNNLRVVMERETVTLADLGIASATAQFEPLLSASYAHASATTPPTTLQAGVVGTLYTQVGDTWTVGANERFQTGTSVQIGTTEVRTSSTFGTAPEPLNYYSQLSLGVTQPVLHGFSTDGTIQRIDILRATIGSDKERKQLAVTIADVVEKTEDAYWELVRAIHGYDLAVRTEKRRDRPARADAPADRRRAVAAVGPDRGREHASRSASSRWCRARIRSRPPPTRCARSSTCRAATGRGRSCRPTRRGSTPQDASAGRRARAVALANRPELASADLDLRAAALSVRKADNDKLPEIDLGAQVSLIGQDARLRRRHGPVRARRRERSGSVTAGFSWTPLQRATSAPQSIERARTQRQTALQRESARAGRSGSRCATRCATSAARRGPGDRGGAVASELAEETLDDRAAPVREQPVVDFVDRAAAAGARERAARGARRGARPPARERGACCARPGGCSTARHVELQVARYSACSASIGSSRAARIAGYSPDATPTTTDTPSDSAIDHVVTTVGQSAYAATPRAMREAERDAGEPAEHRERERGDEELEADVGAARADRAADADLARLLEHRREHDVHDADAADEQRDAGDQAHHEVEQLLGLLAVLEQRLGHDDVVVVARRRAGDRAACRSTAPVSPAGALASRRTTISPSGDFSGSWSSLRSAVVNGR